MMHFLSYNNYEINFFSYIISTYLTQHLNKCFTFYSKSKRFSIITRFDRKINITHKQKIWYFCQNVLTKENRIRYFNIVFLVGYSYKLKYLI